MDLSAIDPTPVLTYAQQIIVGFAPILLIGLGIRVGIKLLRGSKGIV